MNIAATGIDFIRQTEVAGRLRQLLPADAVLHAEEDTRYYECDGLTAYRQLPMIVALPSNEDEVRQVLAACHELKAPVVARGAGTGLSGGALPRGDGVLLSLAKMRRILALDPVARTARVQPGVTNLAISEAAAPYGLFYAPDPSSQIACSIGGNVAENSGGVHCLKYGLTLHNVLRVRAVTVEGEIVEFGGEALDSPGLDLLALMIGSEARDGACHTRLVRRCREGRQRRGRRHRGGRSAFGSGDDGPPGCARGGRVCACRLRPRGRGAPSVRGRRHARGSGREHRAHDRGAPALRGHAYPRVEFRGGTPEVLGRPQSRLPRGGPHIA